MRRFYEKRQAYVSPHTNVNIPHHFHANSPEAVDQAFTVSNLGRWDASLLGPDFPELLDMTFSYENPITWSPTSSDVITIDLRQSLFRKDQ
ncbi:hypothetical protein TNIN_347311 [Trichonephila inaurata madagascariensis]|uniref:Uncharacterized protein n=1 Tax=Trichonephila inaurata madagascariensis TaxID=2747483 RepID=A0A8X6ISC4_9ARAC|nr:hypothetical protein TNIN_347311 [Trichonephila inaurata madagascariensis]